MKYLVIAAVVQIIWGFTPSASRFVLESLPVEGYSAIRYTFSGCLFLLYTWFRYGKFQTRAADIPALAALGIAAYALDSLGTLYGLKVGGPLNFALASSLNAVITAAIALLILKEKASSRFALASVLSIAGGLTLYWGKVEASTAKIATLSLLLIWGAYVLEALGFVFSKKFRKHMPLTEYLAVLHLFAAAFMWSYAGIAGRLPTGIFQMPALGWASLLFVCLFSCSACYFVFYWLLDHLPAHKLAFFDAFHTLAAALFAAVLFEDPFNSKMWLGGALLLSAVIVATWLPKPSTL